MYNILNIKFEFEFTYMTFSVNVNGNVHLWYTGRLNSILYITTANDCKL